MDSHGYPDLKGWGGDGEDDRSQQDEGERNHSRPQHHAQPTHHTTVILAGQAWFIQDPKINMNKNKNKRIQFLYLLLNTYTVILTPDVWHKF